MRGQIAAAGLWAITVLHIVAGVCAAHESPDLVVNIQVNDLAGVPADVRHAAMAEVEKTFQRVGVRVLWNNVPSACRSFTVLIVNGPPVDSSIHSPQIEGVVGDAAPSRGLARVFYRRLVAASALHPVDVGVVLGHVIAHELGHLLLPPGSHAAVGIMRPGVDFRQVAVRRFTDEQSSLIRRALTTQLLTPNS